MATRKKRRKAPARRRARRKVGAINGSTIALVGGGLVLAYLVTRPKTPAIPPPYTVPPSYIPAGALNNTGVAINAGASVLNNLFNNLF